MLHGCFYFCESGMVLLKKVVYILDSRQLSMSESPKINAGELNNIS